MSLVALAGFFRAGASRASHGWSVTKSAQASPLATCLIVELGSEGRLR